MLASGRARITALAATVAVTFGLVALPVSPARAACASPGKLLAGSIAGNDGRYVHVLIGFDVHDRNGYKIDLSGCRIGGAYSKTLSINPDLGGAGAVDGEGLTKSWSIRLPANAADSWIEVYPKTNKPYGATDRSRYGAVMRKAVLPGSTAVKLRLPLVCGISSAGVTGKTGSIKGRVYMNGSLVQADRVRAWSREGDSNSRILGWGMGAGYPDGTYKVPALAAGQDYSLWITEKGQTIKRRLHVDACTGTVAAIRF